MNKLRDTLRHARTRDAGLRQQEFAQLVQLPLDRLKAIERGDAVIMPSELGRYALLFGLDVDDFVAGESGRSSLAHFFMRAKRESGIASIKALNERRVIDVLGRFVRSVRVVEQLSNDPIGPSEPSEQSPLALLDRARYATTDTPPYGAERAARDARVALHLSEKGPIPSMRKLVSHLGITTLFVSPDTLDPGMDGCSIAAPRPAILVNLIGGPQCWWRTRMTLAHELGHLLLDHRAGDGSSAFVSPGSASMAPSRRWRFFDGYERVESRANAFAAHFLAPAEGIRDVVGDLSPTSEQAISAVCTRFGVGRRTAIYRLDHTFQFGVQQRNRMSARDLHEPHDTQHPDVVDMTAIGLHAGEVREAVMTALIDGRVSAVRARAWLGLDLTEPLPEFPGLTEAQRRPLRDAQEGVLRVAQAYLERAYPTDGYLASNVTTSAGGWRVSVEQVRDYCAPPEPTALGLLVSYDLERVELA